MRMALPVSSYSPPPTAGAPLSASAVAVELAMTGIPLSGPSETIGALLSGPVRTSPQ